METHKPPELNQMIIHQSGPTVIDSKRRTTGSIFMTPNVIMNQNIKPNLQHALSTQNSDVRKTKTNILSPIKPVGNLVSPSDSEGEDKMAFDSMMQKINPRSNQSRDKNQYLSQSNAAYDENPYYGVSIENAKQRGINV